MSLLAGCHADEPAGPRLLRHMVAHLDELPADDPLLAEVEWWIVPHANPDGEHRNRSWQQLGPDESEAARIGSGFDPVAFLAERVRELPGDDMEFGFPRDEHDGDARPENLAIHRWWRTSTAPFHLHVSLHGMAFAAGPWFLLEPDWIARTAPLRHRLRLRVERMGYRLHDVERHGEKGFHRIEPGFATRPGSEPMRDHFLQLGDEATAARFRPSSMEAIRRLGLSAGGDPLTIVTEIPLFVLPDVGRELGPPDPAAEEWNGRIAGWKQELATAGGAPGVREDIRARAAKAGLAAVPLRDQMALQWSSIAAGIALRAGAAP